MVSRVIRTNPQRHADNGWDSADNLILYGLNGICSFGCLKTLPWHPGIVWTKIHELFMIRNYNHFTSNSWSLTINKILFVGPLNDGESFLYATTSQWSQLQTNHHGSATQTERQFYGLDFFEILFRQFLRCSNIYRKCTAKKANRDVTLKEMARESSGYSAPKYESALIQNLSSPSERLPSQGSGCSPNLVAVFGEKGSTPCTFPPGP